MADTENPVLIFSDNAALKVRELIEEEGNPSLKLRVFVTGGGCSGFQYGFTFEEEANDDDTLVEKGIIKHNTDLVKVLGDGELTKSLTVKVDKVSASAKQKIEAAGGEVEEPC